MVTRFAGLCEVGVEHGAHVGMRPKHKAHHVGLDIDHRHSEARGKPLHPWKRPRVRGASAAKPEHDGGFTKLHELLEPILTLRMRVKVSQVHSHMSDIGCRHAHGMPISKISAPAMVEKVFPHFFWSREAFDTCRSSRDDAHKHSRLHAHSLVEAVRAYSARVHRHAACTGSILAGAERYGAREVCSALERRCGGSCRCSGAR